jgi:hypothetical protein
MASRAPPTPERSSPQPATVTVVREDFKEVLAGAVSLTLIMREHYPNDPALTARDYQLQQACILVGRELKEAS